MGFLGKTVTDFQTFTSKLRVLRVTLRCRAANLSNTSIIEPNILIATPVDVIEHAKN